MMGLELMLSYHRSSREVIPHATCSDTRASVGLACAVSPPRTGVCDEGQADEADKVIVWGTPFPFGIVRSGQALGCDSVVSVAGMILGDDRLGLCGPWPRRYKLG